MSIKSAGMLLDRFCADEVIVEVTHRSARGLSGLAPLCEVVRPPPTPDRAGGKPVAVVPPTRRAMAETRRSFGCVCW